MQIICSKHGELMSGEGHTNMVIDVEGEQRWMGCHTCVYELLAGLLNVLLPPVTIIEDKP